MALMHVGGMEAERAGSVVGLWVPPALQPAADASHSSVCPGSHGLAQAAYPQHTASTEFGGIFTPSWPSHWQSNGLGKLSLRSPFRTLVLPEKCWLGNDLHINDATFESVEVCAPLEHALL